MAMSFTVGMFIEQSNERMLPGKICVSQQIFIFYILYDLKAVQMRPIKTYRSKNELVYASLRAAIINVELAPGARLVIDDLAAELGVSQIPVREALRQLEADGFVISEPYVGAHVTEIHADSIAEIFGLLEGLEVVSGRMACAWMTDDDLQELDALIAEMEALVENPERWSQENMRLHRLVSAGTPLVARMMDTALDHWSRLRAWYFKGVFSHRVAQAQAEHAALAAAIRTRNPDEVERIVRLHNRAALAAYTDYLQQRETK